MTKPDSTTLVTNIQRFSLDDGPGIRTTVFFKGCPLACRWCHNPECIDSRPCLQFTQSACLTCGACVSVCPSGAQTISDGIRRINRDQCIACDCCVNACESGALTRIGSAYTAQELADLLFRDAVFFNASGGGVTLSGGEPLLHADFCADVACTLARLGISTAIDTSGFIPWTALETVLTGTELFLYDIKAYDGTLHKALTGVDNQLILTNFVHLTRQKAPVLVRIPLVAGLNDNPADIIKLAQFIADHPPVQRVELLGYHSMGANKYSSIGLVYTGSGFSRPSRDRMEALAGIFRDFGLNVVCKDSHSRESARVNEST